MKIPPNRSLRQWLDLIAFLAVLATGIVLIVVGHLTAAEVTTVCTALTGLFAAYHYRRRT